MERWITSQAAAAAHMSLQTSSGLAWCLGPHALPRIHSLSLELRVGVSWGISERFQTVTNLRPLRAWAVLSEELLSLREGFLPMDKWPIIGSLGTHCRDLPTALPLNQLEVSAGPYRTS